MFETENMKNIALHQNDEWGHSVVQDFFVAGGFNSPENLRITHSKFTELVSPDIDDPDTHWEHRCVALATWAYICVELEVPASDFELLIFAIVSAENQLPGNEHSNWIVQLSFDLLIYKYGCDNGTEPELRWLEKDRIASQLLQTCKLAWTNFHRDTPNGLLVMFEKGGIDPASVDILNCEGTGQDARVLKKTIALLNQLGFEQNIHAAFLVLINLGVGSKYHFKLWLEHGKLAEGAVKTLATFYYGCSERSKRDVKIHDNFLEKGNAILKKVTFPSEDEAEFGLLCDVALKAAAVVRNQLAVAGMRKPTYCYFDKWARNASLVSDQWETVERSEIRLHEALVSRSFEIEIPERIRTLTLETGRLVEATLKWTLYKWFRETNELERETTRIKHWIYPTKYNDFIGPILGVMENGSGLEIDELLKASSIKLGGEKDEPIRIGAYRLVDLGKRNQGVWNAKENFVTLIIANAIAARCNPEHPFRHCPLGQLVEFLSVCNAAYQIRNSNAHFSSARYTTSAQEALFWAEAVRDAVDQFQGKFLVK
jgi:hypothetical protein